MVPCIFVDSTLCKDSDEQSYICGFCLKKIHSFALFDLHTAIFHNDRWNYQRLARGFACPLCSLAYSSCITLRQHWLIIHVSSADSMTPKDDVLRLLCIDPVKAGGKLDVEIFNLANQCYQFGNTFHTTINALSIFVHY